MKKKVVIVGLILAVFVWGLSSIAFSSGKIRYVGCGIVKNAFMDELSKKFTQSSGIAMDVEAGGATTGIRAIAAGKADIGGTCRHIVDSPAEKGVKLYHVAWDALAVIVNKQNPVQSISLDQLKKIIEGRIKDWGELGGPANTPIAFYSRDEKTDGVELMLREIIYNDINKELSATKKFESSGPLEKAIEQDAWAVGITGISSARKRNVKIVELNGIDISKGNISSGKYLLYRPLYLVTKENPGELEQKFIQFALSKDGQSIISQQGTVNLKEGSALWKLYRQQAAKHK